MPPRPPARNVGTERRPRSPQLGWRSSVRSVGTHRSEKITGVSFLAAFFAPELRAWRGEMQLWKVYWGYGVLTSLGLALLFLEAVRENQPLIQQAILLALALYTVWILVSVWRCAAHVSPFWRLLARMSTVAWAGNAALVLGFLEFELIARMIAR